MNCTVDIAGEMQIVINDLPEDRKVNVVGMVMEEDCVLYCLIYVLGKIFNFFLSNRAKRLN